MILYHRTNRTAAHAILRNGFRDASGTYMTRRLSAGVWFSNVPLDVNEGTKGDVLLRIVLPVSLRVLDKYEWKEAAAGKAYREWQVPAALVNTRRASVRVVHPWQFQ